MTRQFRYTFLTIFLCGAAALAAAQAPDLGTIVSRMEQAQLENQRKMVPYTVTREYQLFADGQPQPKSKVIASVQFRPPDTKQWSIQNVSGSDRGEKVVKKVLEREADMARGDRIAISRRDYDFRLDGTAGLDAHPCYVLQLLPKRDDKNLLKGRIWVDEQTYQIRHFEGEPARTPSWWIKDLTIILSFGDVGGMWLQTASKGIADVRWFGRHTMTARDLRFQVPSELARNRHRPPAPSPEAAVGAGVLTGR